jgi:predicted RNase H-like HicB family nuclease
MEKIFINVSHTGNNFCAYTEDLPGCVATGKTLDELKGMIVEGIGFHLDGMREDNDPIPAKFEKEYELVYKLTTEALLNAQTENGLHGLEMGLSSATL